MGLTDGPVGSEPEERRIEEQFDVVPRPDLMQEALRPLTGREEWTNDG